MANKLYLTRQAHPGFTLFRSERIHLGAPEATPRSAHGNNLPASSNSINDANISKERPFVAAPTFTFLLPEGTCEFSPRYTHPAPGSAGRSSAPPGWCPLKSLGTPIGLSAQTRPVRPHRKSGWDGSTPALPESQIRHPETCRRRDPDTAPGRAARFRRIEAPPAPGRSPPPPAG